MKGGRIIVASVILVGTFVVFRTMSYLLSYYERTSVNNTYLLRILFTEENSDGENV